jgi:hypothetical protein
MSETGYSSNVWLSSVTSYATAATTGVVFSLNTSSPATTVYYPVTKTKIEKMSEGFRDYLDGIKSLAKKLDLY